jgi:hypothetical protein
MDLSAYAERFHARIGDSHHIASPLGAWLVLELAKGNRAALLDTPHPLVGAATAIWQRFAEPRLPMAGTPLPDQPALDAWAREHTFGLIDRFPVRVSPQTMLILASALATKVTWTRPFQTASAERLGAGSPWAGRLQTVLKTPSGRGHLQYIASTRNAGDVAVHTALAQDGLSVTSVVAAPEVPAHGVIAAAYELIGEHEKRSLFELPLGEAPLWTITEEPAQVTAFDGREERYTSILPAWSAESDHDLSHPDFGFAAAAARLGEALGRPDLSFVARQSALARYSRLGFEAAAVTAMMTLAGAIVAREGVRRTAELRFAHPYAVVAVAEDPSGGPWAKVPAFSAWVAEPEDAS